MEEAGEEVGGNKGRKRVIGVRGEESTGVEGTEGGVPVRRRGWEAKGKQRGERECRIQIEGQFCNVTVSVNCCAGCLTSLIPQKQMPPDVGLTR